MNSLSSAIFDKVDGCVVLGFLAPTLSSSRFYNLLKLLPPTDCQIELRPSTFAFHLTAASSSLRLARQQQVVHWALKIAASS